VDGEGRTPTDEVTRPLNIWSRSDEEIGRLMSHFAHTPFTLDGVEFGSVEAFYTWLVVSGYPDRAMKMTARRRSVASCAGFATSWRCRTPPSAPTKPHSKRRGPLLRG
jgi:predicted NAD-dependent protein-ADP-ribosyltransferase YbiA (DUF1768 family)